MQSTKRTGYTIHGQGSHWSRWAILGFVLSFIAGVGLPFALYGHYECRHAAGTLRGARLAGLGVAISFASALLAFTYWNNR